MKFKFFSTSLPILALIIAHFIWGINFVVAKIALQEFPVMTLAFLRFSLASLLIVPFLLVFEKKQLTIKLDHLPKLFLGSLLMITLNIAFFYEGLTRTSAIDASVLSMSIPIISVIGGWWFLKEKIYWMNFLGIILGLVGSVIILGLPLFFVGSANPSVLIGNLLILLACVFFVIGAIIFKQLLYKYHPLVISAIAFLVGSITFLIPAALEYINNPGWVNNISILGILSLLFITVLSSICAFFLMNWGLEKTGVIKANLFHYIEPAIAATFAVQFLGERISYSFIVGTILVVLGVYWGTLGKSHHHHSMHKHHRS